MKRASFHLVLAALVYVAMTLFGLPTAYASLPAGQIVPQETARVQAAPGKPGWLNQSGSNFIVNNYISQSNYFATSVGGTSFNTQWTAETGVTLPGTTGTDPLSGATATDIQVANIGAGSHGVMYQTNANGQYFGWQIQLNAQDMTPGVAGQLYLIVRNSGGTVFRSAPIPSDGNPHTVILNLPQWVFGATNWQAAVGIDRRDASETNLPGTAVTKKVRIDDFEAVPMVRGPPAYVGGPPGPWPYVDNTGTSVVNKEVFIPLPVGMAFRDWSKVQAWASAWNKAGGYSAAISAVTIQDPLAGTELYQHGGVSQPFIAGGLVPTGPNGNAYSGQLCGFASMTDGQIQGTTPGEHNNWYDFGNYCGKTIFQMQEVAPGTTQSQVHLYGAKVWDGTSIGTIAASGNSYTTGGNGTLNLTLSANSPFLPGQTVDVVLAAGTPSGNMAGLDTQWIVSTSSSSSPNIQLTGATSATGNLSITTITGGKVLLGNAGIGGAINITSASYTSPTVTITLSSAPPFVNGSPILIQGVTGTGAYNLLNTYQTVNGVNTGNNTFTFNIASGQTMTLNTGTGTVQATGASIYGLHPWWVPGGCTVASIFHYYCIHFSAESASAAQQDVFLAYADGINSTWNVYGGSSPLIVLPHAQGSYSNYPGLPTDILVPGSTASNGTVYMFTQGQSAAVPGYAYGEAFQLWQFPQGDGINSKYVGGGTQGELADDWDVAGSTHPSRLDPGIYKNRCGFYEMYYTSYRASPQFNQYTASGTATSSGGSTIVTLTLTQPITLPPGSTIFLSNPGCTPTACTGNYTSLMGTYTNNTATVNSTTVTFDAGANKCPSACFFDTVSLQIGGPSKNQAIGEFISDSPLGPWHLLQQAAIPLGSQLYGGITTIGETNIIHQGSLIYWTGNIDNGTAASAGMGGFMQDACVASPVSAANDNEKDNEVKLASNIDQVLKAANF